MTDAREIIAQYLCDRAGQGWSGISTFERAAYRTVAQGMIAALTAAGFRIIGPDEVDQVTLERAAEVAANLGSEIPAAIRALASGESR